MLKISLTIRGAKSLLAHRGIERQKDGEEGEGLNPYTIEWRDVLENTSPGGRTKFPPKSKIWNFQNAT